MLRAFGLVSIVATFLACASNAGAEERITVGNTFTVVRTVMGTLDANMRQLKLADDIYHNELIETGDGSATEVVFVDETKLALGPNSSIVLDKFVYDPRPDQSSFVATATKGVFRFVTGNLPKSSYTIHTPTATIGIRGTIFSLAVLPQQTTDGSQSYLVRFSLEEGAADISGCGADAIHLEAPGEAVTLSSIGNGVCSSKLSPF
jgi:FecR protein